MPVVEAARPRGQPDLVQRLLQVDDDLAAVAETSCVIMPPTRWLSMSASVVVVDAVAALPRWRPARLRRGPCTRGRSLQFRDVECSPNSSQRALRARLRPAGSRSGRLRPEGPAVPAHRCRPRRRPRHAAADLLRPAPAARRRRRRPHRPPAAGTRRRASRNDATPRLPGHPHIAYRDGALHVEGVSLADLAREHGTPLFVYSKAVDAGRAGRLPARLRGPQCADLLRDEGQLLARRAAGVRRGRLRLRHRLGRRTRARAGRRRRPGEDHLLGRRQDARRDAAGARRPASAASTSRAKPSSRC